MANDLEKTVTVVIDGNYLLKSFSTQNKILDIQEFMRFVYDNLEPGTKVNEAILCMGLPPEDSLTFANQRDRLLEICDDFDDMYECHKSFTVDGSIKKNKKSFEDGRSGDVFHVEAAAHVIIQSDRVMNSCNNTDFVFCFGAAWMLPLIEKVRGEGRKVTILGLEFAPAYSKKYNNFIDSKLYYDTVVEGAKTLRKK